MTQRPRRISDYAFISDCHSAALVAEGRVEWLCFPRFDSPSVFAAMLDVERGGCFALTPEGDLRCSRAYEAGTNVLVTRFEDPSGCIEITDCLPVHPPVKQPVTMVRPYHALLRRLRCTAGQATIHVLCDPRPNYARGTPAIRQEQGRWLLGDGDERLVLDTEAPLGPRQGGGLEGRLTLSAGEQAVFVLQYAGAPAGLPLPPRIDPKEALGSTLDFWRDWSGRLQYDGPYKDAVLRSALVLKGLTFPPSGGIIAAPTTSLPEWFGGGRNWDYRYCWLRDSTLTLYALERIGYRAEAYAFGFWLMQAAADSTALRIAYTLEGQDVPREQQLDHLAGFRDSRPVRIGNDARHQVQLDIFGELLDVAFFGDKQGIEISSRYWSFLAGLADYVAEHWREPDQGIWEVRTPPQEFVYSKVLCWVALNRAIRLAQALGARDSTERWAHEMEAIRHDVLQKGYNPAVGAFVQAYGSQHLDASNLALPILGFISARDPRMAATIRRTEEQLVQNGLVRRYAGVDDGLSGDEGAFLICSFWLIDALCMLGEREKARGYFESLIARANDVGLLSEEFDPASGEMLGNFPQAFSHLGLITSALNLQGGHPNRRHADHAAERQHRHAHPERPAQGAKPG